MAKVIDAIKSINYKDVLTRALWTFLQAFIAVFIIAGESIIDLLFVGDWTALLTLLIATAISALAAGLSVLKTIVVETIRVIKSRSEL